jgi:serine/threonine protein kinase
MQSILEDMNFHTGAILKGRYEIVSELGEGGFGSVFKAQDLALNRAVALKLLKSETLDSQQLAERFQRESRVLAQLSHRNILSVYSYELTEDYTPFLVMEFLDGLSLASVLEKNKSGLDYQSCKNVFMQICQGLAWAHKQDVVHRDLGSANIMITSGETTNALVKILDFGLATITQTSASDTSSRGYQLTKTGVLIGNPAYLSPEGCRGQKLDRVSDIYSLGCLLYEMLNGKKPFESWNPMELIVQHQTRYPEEPVLNWGNKDAELLYKNLALICMQKERERRPQSVDQIIEILNEKLEIEPILKKARSWGQSGGEKSNRAPVAALVGTLVILALSMSATFLLKTASPKKTEQISYKNVSSAEKKWKDRIAQLRLHSKNTSILIEPLEQLSLVYEKEGKTELAVETMEEALKLIRQDPERELYPLIRAVGRLMELKNVQGKYADAEKLAREGVVIEGLRRGKITNDYGAWLIHLGRALASQKKYVEAEVEYKKGLDVYAKNKDIDAPAYITALLQNVSFYKGQEKFDDAISLYDIAIKTTREIEEPTALDKSRLVEIQLEKARLQRIEGKQNDAEQSLKAAISSAKAFNDPRLLSHSLKLANSIRSSNTEDLGSLEITPSGY